MSAFPVQENDRLEAEDLCSQHVSLKLTNPNQSKLEKRCENHEGMHHAEVKSNNGSPGSEDADDAPKTPWKDFSIDNQLEEKLKKHGLSRRNVKTIIHELLNDQKVRELLKANLQGDEDGEVSDQPIAKSLRSAAKKPLENVTDAEEAPFADLPLPDEEEDDEDYEPGADTAEDTQDTLAPTPNADLDTSAEDLLDAESVFIQKMNDIDAQFDAITKVAEDAASAADNEIIAQRTRSKRSMHDTALAELELAFKPPDVTDDMYPPPNDTEWHRWLVEMVMDETLTLPQAAAVEVEDDPEKDPDYNVLASESEDLNETDDYKDDHGFRISKKEVQDLLDLLDAPSPNYFGEYEEEVSLHSPEPSTSVFDPSVDMDRAGSEKQSTSTASQAAGITVKQRLEKMREENALSCPPAHREEARKESALSSQNTFQFSQAQLQTLDVQMRQHVQMLAQVNLLCRNTSRFSTVVHDSYALLKELEQLGEYNKNLRRLSKSCFDASNLGEALRVAQLPVKDSDPVTRLTKYKRTKGLLPIPRGVATVVASSSAFQFSRLLPTCAAVVASGESSRVVFIPPEDNIVVLGLMQMQDHFVPCNTLIHQYMMPCKSPDQIRSRIMNATSGHCRPDNSIRLFKRTGRIPPVPPLALADVGQASAARTPLHLRDVEVPDWLLALQQELLSNNPTPSKSVKTQQVGTGGVHQSNRTAAVQLPIVTCAPNLLLCNPLIVTNVSTLPTSVITMPAIIAKPRPGVAQVSPFQGRRASTGLSCRTSSSPSKKKNKRFLEKIRKSFSPAKKKRYSRRGRPPNKKAEDDALARETTVSGVSAARMLQLHKSSPNSEKNARLGPGVEAETSTLQNKAPSASLAPKPRDVFPNAYGEDAATNGQLDNTVPQGEKNEGPNKEALEVMSVDFPAQSENNATLGVSSIAKESAPEQYVTVEEDDFDQDTEDDNRTMEEDDNLTEEEDLLTTPGVDLPSRELKSSGWKGKMRSRRGKKTLRVTWKNRGDKSSHKLGGRLHRLHPGLAGKKASNKTEEDALGKNLRMSAEKVRLLEEDTIVQLDPTRVEKEMMFAQCYLNRMKEVLKQHEEVFLQALEILCQFEIDSTQSPPGLFEKLSHILKPWPQLLHGFAPFLLPEQAQACGLLKEQQVYARARKFLRQLEIRFQDNPHHLSRILNAFHVVAENGVYNEHEIKSNILSLLKADIYLQEEFLMFFDDERPPESRLHGEHEEITWSEDLVKDNNIVTSEHIIIPSSDAHDLPANHDEGPGDDLGKSPSSQARQNVRPAGKENVDPNNKKRNQHGDSSARGKRRGASWGANKSDEDSDVDANDNGNEDRLSSSCLPADIGVISEDALSCSPFKRHSSTSAANAAPRTPEHLQRPPTPVPTQTLQEPVLIADCVISQADSSSFGSSELPKTPTASPKSCLQEPDNADTSAQKVNRAWTRDEDTLLLNVCKTLGASEEAFAQVASSLNRPLLAARQRFQHLMTLVTGECMTDTDTCSRDSESDDASSD